MKQQAEAAIDAKFLQLGGTPVRAVTDDELEGLLEDNSNEDLPFALRGELGIVIHVPLADTAVAVGRDQEGVMRYTYLDGVYLALDRTFEELDGDTQSWLWAALQS